MTRIPWPLRRLLTEQRGVVFLEFLVAFIPIWVFFLCLIQLALISRANLMVKHAADSAARSAAVVLPDDPNEYGGEPAMSIGRNRITGGDVALVLGTAAARLREPSPQSLAAAFSNTSIANLGRSRLNTIRMAAHVPLMPLAPINVGRDSRPSIRKAIGGRRGLLSALYYQPFAVAVTFPGVEGDVVSGPEIAVRVSYAFQCTVPLARRLLCKAFDELDAAEDFEDAFFPLAQRIVAGRFRQLQHETTLMIHQAPYGYRVRGS